MGYYIKQRHANFTIKKKNIEPALKALIQDADDNGGASWVCGDVVQKSQTFKEAMGEWRWEVMFDEKGDVVDIYFTGEKSGEDGRLFGILSPFVEPDSYIEMSGEEGEIWRWSFDGKSYQEIGADICFNEKGFVLDKILEKKELLPLLMNIHPHLDKMIASRLK